LGAVYTQGLLYTYLEAAALFIAGGFHPLLARFPSLLLSAITLALMIYAARVLFRTWPAGVAALWLALDGEAIVWGSRARTYALLQPLVLGAFLAWYKGAIAKDRPGLRWLAIGLLLAALVDQQVTMLVLPPLALLAVMARGWGWLRQPVVWLQAGTVVLGVAARELLYRLMVLPGTTATSEPRLFVNLTQPLAGWETVVPFVTDPNRLLAALVAAGVVWCLLPAAVGHAQLGPARSVDRSSWCLWLARCSCL
jgi:4-amino-4-deoxy-L-arabinose transferase-like glycosyltransferase